jgi:hypothetical protein
MIREILPLVAITVLFASGCIESANIGIPENYYFNLKPADVNSPIELIRFATSIRPYTTDFTVPERLAFFEWYLKNRGFNVSFVYSNNFRNSGTDHTWLVLRNKVGENMAIEPSYIEMKAESISPTTSDYKNYQKKFADIYELSKNTGGSDKYAWWKKSSGQDILNENIMLHKKSQL